MAEESRKATVAVRCKPETLERLKKLSAKRGIPMSDLLDEYVPRKKKV